MPFTEIPGAIDRFQNKTQLERPPTSAGEQIVSAFKLENVIVGIVDAAGRETYERNPEFNPLDVMQDEDLVYAKQLGRAGSQKEYDEIKRRIANESKLREILEDGPLNSLLAEFMAIAGDPTSYLGFGVGAAGRAGVQVGTRVARGAIAGTLETAAAEAALQGLQETRTIQESLGSILLGGAFGAGLGGIGGALANRAYRRGVDDFNAIMKDGFPQDMEPPIDAPGPRAVGAEAAGLTPEETQIAKVPGLAKTLAKLKGVVSPATELMASANAATRNVMSRMFDSVYVLEGNVKFRTSGPTVDTRIKRWDAVRAGNFEAAHLYFKKHRQAGGKLNKNDFLDAVGGAMRRGDKHPIPEVQEAAQWYRKEVFDPLKERAIRAGLLPEDVSVETAVSYFTRVYNVEMIHARLDEFLNVVEAYLRRTIPLKELASEAEYRDVARDIVNNITGAPGGRVPFINQPLKRGPLAERTFNIPDSEVEEFLISDVSHVAERYINTLAPDVELVDAFGRVDLDDQIKAMRDETNIRAEKAGSQTERQKILAQGRREEDILNALVQMSRNMFDTPTSGAGLALRRAGRGIRAFNYLRLLGSVALSSIPDIGRIVMEEGLARTFGTLVSGLADGFRSIRMAKREAQLAGTALDVVLSTRAKAIYDIGEQYQSVSKFERGIDYAANKFGLVSLLSPWNTTLKSWAGAVISTRMLTAVRKAGDGSISQRDVEKLARAGIDRPMAERIAAQAEHFEDNNGVILANTEDWTDAQAVEAFRMALVRDIDNTIITPGAADAPVWTSTEFGKMVFQFKRFASASVDRVVVGGLQAKDMAALNGIMVMVGLGGMGRALLDLATDGEVEERSTRSWIAESLDRSGVLALYTEMDAISDKAIGMSPMTFLAGDTTSRFRSRNLLGQLGGPFAGAIQDIQNAIRGSIEGDFTQSDLHRIRRLAPGQNLLYLRSLLDQLEEAAGLPERSTSR